ncbi:uncharacterized protein TNIN_224361 [Trichonephila inaurata madagascariensis]|uniref:Uncharacterized protein n=1 Tax=Trichonephila inaurata madagascariensis TaxID=2747483 RepID=A0A8X6Y6P9_9ARAC|nr:uncharacterized protein TNIN_224361 [Trichonephila inaurata madagascariensis]
MVPIKPQKAFCAFCGLRPPHFHNDMRRYLKEHLPQRGRTDRDDKALLKWPMRSPDIMPCDFFLRGFIKDIFPQLPRDLVELCGQIRNEFPAVTRDMLVRIS